MGNSPLSMVRRRAASNVSGGHEAEVTSELRAGRLSIDEERKLVKELRTGGTESSVQALRECLRSSDTNVTVDAARGLGEIGTDEAVDALIMCLSMEPTARLAIAAVWLRRLRSRRVLPAVLHCLETRNEELRYGQKRILILALGEMPHVGAIPVLSAALRDPRYRMRYAATSSLTRIRAPESLAALEAAARELSWLRAFPIRRGIRVRKRRADQG
jgi:HEAT repeat protein